MSRGVFLRPIIDRFRPDLAGDTVDYAPAELGPTVMPLPHVGRGPIPYPRAVDVTNLDGARASGQLFVRGPLDRPMESIAYAGLVATHQEVSRDVAGARRSAKGGRVLPWLFGGGPASSTSATATAAASDCEGC